MPGNELYPSPLRIQTAAEAHPGAAELITVLEGEKLESFRIEILDQNQENPTKKDSFSFRVTDPRLLSVSGGVVQGMSGSPIVQDGKFAGVVTHVLVNEPCLGYACRAAQMYAEAMR